jgi:D-alanine-D-alanine ligase-like ATP-grasp enzyme
MTRSEQRSRQSSIVGPIFKKVAPRLNARVLIEPRWQVVGQITYKSGKKRYFRSSSIDLNGMGASAVAKDKDYANFFMSRMGYPTIPGSTFFSPKWARTIRSRQTIDAGYRYARRLGFPVIVKPNSGTQGQHVALVYNKREFYLAMRAVFREDNVALVQRLVSGNDYRLVVLDHRVISAYHRIPLNVVGDGRATVSQLLRRKQRLFGATERDTVIDVGDRRIAQKLARQGLDFRSVVPAGARVFLLDNANLSSGGDSVDVTKRVHPGFRRLAVTLTGDMGLRLCGVDLMIEGDIASAPSRYWILEINSAPGLDHYARTGAAQRRIVEKLYLEVLRSMEH